MSFSDPESGMIDLFAMHAAGEEAKRIADTPSGIPPAVVLDADDSARFAASARPRLPIRHIGGAVAALAAIVIAVVAVSSGDVAPSRAKAPAVFAARLARAADTIPSVSAAAVAAAKAEAAPAKIAEAPPPPAARAKAKRAPKRGGGGKLVKVTSAGVSK